MPDTSVGEMASDGSFAVNYTGTGFAPWFGFRQLPAARR